MEIMFHFYLERFSSTLDFPQNSSISSLIWFEQKLTNKIPTTARRFLCIIVYSITWISSITTKWKHVEINFRALDSSFISLWKGRSEIFAPDKSFVLYPVYSTSFLSGAAVPDSFAPDRKLVEYTRLGRASLGQNCMGQACLGRWS